MVKHLLRFTGWRAFIRFHLHVTVCFSFPRLFQAMIQAVASTIANDGSSSFVRCYKSSSAGTTYADLQHIGSDLCPVMVLRVVVGWGWGRWQVLLGALHHPHKELLSVHVLSLGGVVRGGVYEVRFATRMDIAAYSWRGNSSSTARARRRKGVRMRGFGGRS